MKYWKLLGEIYSSNDECVWFRWHDGSWNQSNSFKSEAELIKAGAKQITKEEAFEI